MLASLAAPDESLPTLAEVVRVLTFRAGYNTSTVLLGVTLLGVAGGVVGVFALLRKRALMADALSHATLPGVALAFLAALALGFSGRSLPILLLGAAITGVLGVVCVQLLLRVSRLREDAAIGIVLSVFFGAGIVLLSIVQNSGSANAAGLNHFIYGQTAAMRVSDAALMGGIALASIVLAFLLLKEFGLVCFNAAFA
ncbi:MAG: metal ABC transporter permease, partial [Phycisphaerales bacterium]